MRTGHITAARSELEQNGYISEDTLANLSPDEVLFIIEQTTQG
ncbi:TPA: hypothetical protein ACKQCJ_000397 [Stenotrophomonas maltophilia]